jgi:hypothetical protein
MKPFLDLPPGLGGAMAMTARRLGVGEAREMLLGFEEKVLTAIGEPKREEESLTLSVLLEEDGE